MQAVDAKYIENAAKVGPNQIVTFEADEIKLDIAVEGVDLKSGWTITPYTHPGVSLILDHFSISVIELQVFPADHQAPS